MSAQKRTYTMRKRAALEEETRLRITESAVELHGSVGPAATTVSAIAERAGVRRSTVYRHFPDEVALFDACSAHWSAANPPPDIGAWAQVDDPGARLRTALTELYAYYARNEQMLANLLRDEATVAVVAQRFAGFHGFLAAARDLMLAGRPVRGRRRAATAAAAGHALAFSTWRSLVREQGCDEATAVALMCELVAGAGAAA